MPTISKSNAALWGRVGGTVRAARHDPQILAKSGYRGLMARFERDVDPDGTLDPVEREVRAKRLMRAHMLRMNAIRVANQRRAKAAASDGDAS